MTAFQKTLRIALPLLVVAAGATVMATLIKGRERPHGVAPERRAPLVDVLRLQPGDHRASFHTQGTVVPARQVVLSPEVSGRVVYVAPEVVPGGRVEQGQVLLRIDSRDYRAAVAQAQGQVAQAELQLAVEQGRKDIAEREWNVLSGKRPADGPARSLALREPHMDAARAGLVSAKSAVLRARLALERTTLRAPFAAIVQQESVEPGQVVAPQARLITLVGAEKYWVRVSVQVQHVPLVDLPDDSGHGGSAATLSQGVGAPSRAGRVVRLLGDVDPLGRMARVVVEVDDPLGLSAEPGSPTVPLLLDSFVDVKIEGRVLKDVFEVPRLALRNGDRVYLASADDRLVVREVQVAWRTPDSVLVHAGLEAGDRLITGHVPGPVDGMSLRIVGSAAPSPTARTEARVQRVPAGSTGAGERPER